jgi:MFS family permease
MLLMFNYRNLAATMFAPGAAELAKEFGITNNVVSAFTVSIYMLGFAFGPLTIAPLSEVYGRIIVIHIANAFFIAFTIGCALSTNTAMFFVFRFLAGCACSAPMTIGGGIIADVTEPAKRGAAMSMWAMGPLLGPVLTRNLIAFYKPY